VAALRDNPDGSVPLESDQLYGVVPPVAESVALYATPSCPLGSELVTILRGPGRGFALAVVANIETNARLTTIEEIGR
jgi:hypothetical protein